MPTEIENARAKLRSIQHAGRDRWKEIGELHNAIDLAKSAVEKLERELARFSDLDARAARDRIERLKAAAKSGIAPTGEVGEEIKVMAAEKVEIENKLSAAREALSLLQRELGVEETRAKNFDREIILAAEAVLVAEFESEAQVLNRAIYELRECKAEIDVIVNSVMIFENTVLPFHTAPYPVPRRITWGGQMGACFGTDVGRNRWLPVEQWGPYTEKWTAFFDALKNDADALYPGLGMSGDSAATAA